MTRLSTELLRYMNFYYRLFDLVKNNKDYCYIFEKSENFDIRKLNGEKISKDINCSKSQLIYNMNNIIRNEVQYFSSRY